VDRPRVSRLCFFSYFYYKAGCQVLLVKKHDEYIGVSGLVRPADHGASRGGSHIDRIELLFCLPTRRETQLFI
jgi:hypothetical protein